MKLVRTDVVRILLPAVCDGWTNVNARVTSEYCQRLIKHRLENVAIPVR